MTHETVTAMEHKAGDTLRYHAPIMQQKGGEAFKRTVVVLG
jgi:hypothetical protein